MTLCVHRIEPKWPIESGRERHAISIEGTDYWAETSGGAPVLSDVRRVLGLDIDLAPLILAERGRRLAAGFDYAFGDARGTHRIGTTDADRKGWDEVSTYAGALIDSGDVETKINIVTDTGPCQVTAPEWRAIELAAAQFRQPIWAASFVLLASLPPDYADDRHWA